MGNSGLKETLFEMHKVLLGRSHSVQRGVNVEDQSGEKFMSPGRHGDLDRVTKLARKLF